MIRHDIAGMAVFATTVLALLPPADLPGSQRTRIADVANHPEQFFGTTLSVDGAVNEIYGPHLFGLDQQDLAQPESDLFVFLPEGSVAAVREKDRVTVTGTMKRLAWPDVTRQARWLEAGVLNRELTQPAVLVATRIVEGNSDRVMMLTARGAAIVAAPDVSGAITSIATMSAGDLALVGRRIALPPVVIHSIDRAYGFCVSSGDRNFFVMVHPRDMNRLRVGDAVAVNGVILALPPALAGDLRIPIETNTLIYVYADRFKSGR